MLAAHEHLDQVAEVLSGIEIRNYYDFESCIRTGGCIPQVWWLYSERHFEEICFATDCS